MWEEGSRKASPYPDSPKLHAFLEKQPGNIRYMVQSYGADCFDVFHLTGHADVKDGQPHFIMENELGFKHEASAEEIAQAFSGIWPRLVFLSGCPTSSLICPLPRSSM